MDLPCPKCLEPWDNDSLHEEAEASGRTYDQVAADFRKQGCHALNAAFGPMDPCESATSADGDAARELYALLGDDMDAASAMWDDFQYLKPTV